MRLRQSGQLRRTPRREVVEGLAETRAWPLRQSTWKLCTHERWPISVVIGQRGSKQMEQFSMAGNEEEEDEEEDELADDSPC